MLFSSFCRHRCPPLIHSLFSKTSMGVLLLGGPIKSAKVVFPMRHCGAVRSRPFTNCSTHSQSSVTAGLRGQPTELSAAATRMVELLNSPAWFVHGGGGGPGVTAATTMITKATIPTTSTVTTPTTMIHPPRSPLAAATVPISSMRDLVHQVPLVVQQRKVHSIEPGSSQDPVMNLLRHSQLPHKEWSRYAFFDPSKPYTRNLIATDHSTYTLLLLCWNPQHESPIHDHPCDGCWLKVLQGTLRECRYNDDLHCISDMVVQANQIAHITDSMGYHKIGNPTAFTPAVSLHIYAPPIQECRIWTVSEDDNLQQQDTASTTSGVACSDLVRSGHYSEYGRLIYASDP